jgi:LPXTG-site transpeptidase (sortase) family protein
MTIRQLKLANLFIWSGVALLLLALALSYPTLSVYLTTLRQTRQIATAPALDEALVREENASPNLLPFEGEQESYRNLGALLEGEPDTPTTANQGTPTPTLTITTEPTEASANPTESATTPTPRPPTATPQPTATPTGVPPASLSIPAIDLEAPVVPIGWETEGSGGNVQTIWQVPDWRAAGWHDTSAPLGVPGNTVLNGHNTTRGEVFRDLYKMEEGEAIFVTGTNDVTFTYRIENIYIVEEAGQPLDVRIQNARYIQSTTDERLTLITCHPYASTRYRLIIIAKPTDRPDNLQ